VRWGIQCGSINSAFHLSHAAASCLSLAGSFSARLFNSPMSLARLYRCAPMVEASFPTSCHVFAILPADESLPLIKARPPANFFHNFFTLSASCSATNRLAALFTSPRQHAPEGFLSGHAHNPCFKRPAMSCGIEVWPVSNLFTRVRLIKAEAIGEQQSISRLTHFNSGGSVLPNSSRFATIVRPVLTRCEGFSPQRDSGP
jgi:hypothetical protein